MELSGKTSSGSKSDSSNAGFVQRLAVVEEKFATRKEAAAAAKIAQSTFQRWAEGKAAPNFHGVASLAKAAGVSLDWLAFGEGDQGVAERKGWYRYDPPYNYDWMWQIIDMLGDLYRMNGIEPETDQLLHEAADIYGEAAKIEDPDERMRAISMTVAVKAKVLKPSELPAETADDQRQA